MNLTGGGVGVSGGSDDARVLLKGLQGLCAYYSLTIFLGCWRRQYSAFGSLLKWVVSRFSLLNR